jgi:hypothetical protein
MKHIVLYTWKFYELSEWTGSDRQQCADKIIFMCEYICMCVCVCVFIVKMFIIKLLLKFIRLNCPLHEMMLQLM